MFVNILKTVMCQKCLHVAVQLLPDLRTGYCMSNPVASRKWGMRSKGIPVVFVFQNNKNGVPATEYRKVNQIAVTYIAGQILCVREHAVTGVGIINTLCAQL
jgi:hypothetical protein